MSRISQIEGDERRDRRHRADGEEEVGDGDRAAAFATRASA